MKFNKPLRIIMVTQSIDYHADDNGITIYLNTVMTTRREEQKSYFYHINPRPLNFFKKFRYRNSSNAQTRLCDSKKLLNLKSEWENDEYEDDWERYKDFKNSIKTNPIKLLHKQNSLSVRIKKRKREAHISFHEE
ncbi:hypothetical protein C2G38_2242164 [Gigaspora rosea]|uniref:Uncharacterized protein n=1 Tax=Gigaspora rosea TaxID=44941 RepID=A0A397VNU5_9GLOM|nr:hypothetical protein C2G38_2242164 [Gigaspora rosea]